MAPAASGSSRPSTNTRSLQAFGGISGKEARLEIQGRTVDGRLGKRKRAEYTAEEEAFRERRLNMDTTEAGGDNRIEGSEADYKEKLELLDHECRIMYFLTFRHDHGSFSKTMIVRSLLPRGTTPGNDNFKDMRLLCMEKVKNHKQALVDGAIVSLRTVYFIRYY
jgi:hypothetical protein